MPEIINGFLFAQNRRMEMAQEVAVLKQKTGKVPVLAVIIAGNDPASQIYVRNKEKAAAETGIDSRVYRLPAETGRQELSALVKELNETPEVNSILVQLPLPAGIDETVILNAILPEKDVDGFHPVNLGRLMAGHPGTIPCTPKGCLELIRSVCPQLSGLNAVVIGRSNIVGKPMAQLLLNENCTVTITHSQTKDLPAVCARADILVAAAGRPKMVKADWVKEGAIVIDVGINRMEDGKLCGDVDFDAVAPKCRAITPVPKGVGPMTIAMLLDNAIEAFCAQNGINR